MFLMLALRMISKKVTGGKSHAKTKKHNRGSAKTFQTYRWWRIKNVLKPSQATVSMAKLKKQRRHLRKQTMVHATDIKRIKQQLSQMR